MNQFVTTPTVIDLDDLPSFFQVLQPSPLQKFIDMTSLADVGVEHLVRAGKLHEQLPIFTQRSGIERPSELLPGPAAVPQFNILPDLVIVLITLPGLGIVVGYVFFDVGEETATADEADTEFIEELKELLRKETAIEADDDRHILTIPLPDQRYDMLIYVIIFYSDFKINISY